MENTSENRIVGLLAAQKRYFHEGHSLSVGFRKEMLRRLGTALQKWEKPLCDALYKDLHKSYEEAYMTELSIIKAEIRTHLRHLRRWARPIRRSTPVKMFPSRSYLVSEPLGNALIIAPWNYPVQLLLNPLVGAISAGCTAVLKPSPYVPHVSRVIEKMVSETFDEEYIAVVQGNREVNRILLEQRYDLIFFTGSPALGRKVMEAASRNLTPVVLELGGKSPCIVDRDADIRLAARRIAWGKTLNAGQTCIAPDYLLIHEDVKEAFVKAFAEELAGLHCTSDMQESRHYVRMVNKAAYDRVLGYIEQDKVLLGGGHDAEERYIEPTLMDATEEMPAMQEEIFGPLLPVLTFRETREVRDFVRRHEKPLAFYYFGNERTGWELIRVTSSGGACINDTIMHIVNENIPFGGVGNSGMGCYHGRESFRAFSHRRSVVCTPTWIDLPFRYMPYKFFDMVKKII